MDEQSNTMATVSLGAGVGVWVLWMVCFCVGMIPLIGVITWLAVPILFLLAITGIVTGIMGYRQSKVSSVGGGAALAGLGLSVTWLVIDVCLWIVGIGFMGLYTLLAIASGAH